jgi:quinoprotein dehydrogenase-associated probable ABC transporter substrate-binding protein
VCSDPNNLPFSNHAQQGFENRIAELVARDLGTTLEYTWWSERKSFIKNSLDEGLCDVVIGVPADLGSVLTTKPYYRSTYVFAFKKDRELHLSSLSDARLAGWRIGVHITGDDYAPPAYALASRGLSGNLVGYSLFGAYGEVSAPAKIIAAVARGDVDVVIVWGPLAGYFAKREKTALEIVPVSPQMFMAVPFTYSISAGVRKGETRLKTELENALMRQCQAIQNLLVEFGVPQPLEGQPQCEASQQSASAFSR